MFIQMKNFSVVAAYAQIFQEGLVVTILLSLFTVDRLWELLNELPA